MGIQLNGTSGTDVISAVDGSLTVEGLTISGDFNIADKIIHSGDTNTAIRFPTNNNFTVETAGVERLRITGSGELYLGPHKNGTAAQNVPYEIRVAPYGWSASQDIAAISMGNHSGATGNDDGEIVFKTALNAHTDASALTEKVRIDSGGRVQIGGVIGPGNAKLFVSGTNSNSYVTLRNTSAGDGSGARWNSIRFQGTQSGGEVSDLVQLQANHDGTSDDEKGSFQILVNDGNDGDSLQEALRINSSGYMGIGAINPSYALMIQGSGNAASGIYLYNNTGAEGIKISPESNGNCRIYSSTADALCLGTNGTDRITIAANGSSINFTGTDFGFNTTPGGTPAGKAVFLAIGDSDTGIVQDGDGQLEIWGNAVEVANFNAIDGYTSTKRVYTTGTGRFGQTRVNSTSESADGAFNDLIVGDHSGNRGISILSANGSHSTLGFAKSGALSDGYIQYKHESTATSSWMRVKSSGQIILNTAGTDRLTVRAGSGATNDKIQINQSNGGFYHSHHSAGITPANNDWVYFGYIAYGSSQRGQFVVEWSSIHAPSCCYHGYAILEAGSSHGPDYDYVHSESIELLAYDSHGAHNFKAWKLVDSSSSGGSHLKIFGQWSGSTVQSGTFHMTVLPSKTMFGQTIVGATPAVDNNSYNGTRLTIDGRFQQNVTSYTPDQLRLNKSMFGIFHASSGLDTAGAVTTRGTATGANGTIWCNYGGITPTRNGYTIGSYTPFAGMVAPCGSGARYLHVKFNLTAGVMWLVDIKGYEYNGTWTSDVNGSSVSNDHIHHSISGGYHYNSNALYNGKAAAYRGITPGWYLHGGYICCYIDTNNTGTTNRWGFYKFEGGCDGIIGQGNQKPSCVIAWTYSTGTGSAF